MQSSCNWIIPDWPAPQNVKALTTLRQGGQSIAPYDHFNLALHVGDNPATVLANRAQLRRNADLPQEPFWLTQVHGIEIVNTTAPALTGKRQDPSLLPPEADAFISFEPNQVGSVLTADCLPVLLCDKAGTRVAAVHAGWRGLSKGILEAVTAGLQCEPSQILAWLGPAIGPEAFEVKEDVLQAFKADPLSPFFKSTGKGSWFADIYQLATHRLNRVGITAVYGGQYCTYRDRTQFYSFRRSGITGRMASLIWFTA